MRKYKTAATADCGQASVKTSPNLESADHRLLQYLADDGGRAAKSEFGKQGALDVYALRKGVSLRIAGSNAISAETLVRHDLAQWCGSPGSSRRYLNISDAGRAYLARKAAKSGDHNFLAQHQELLENEIEVSGLTAKVTVDASESPLAWLARRKGPGGGMMIDATQLEAGERLRRDIEQAQLRSNITANWSSVGQGGNRGEAHQHISDLALAARQRVDAAFDGVGSDCAGILLDVCGFLKGLGTIEFERGWPRRSAKVVVSIALSALARHYGLSGSAIGNSTGKIRHWGSADFRPDITEKSGSRETSITQ